MTTAMQTNPMPFSEIACIIASIFDYKPETFIDEENYEENKKLNKEEVHFDKF